MLRYTLCIMIGLLFSDPVLFIVMLLAIVLALSFHEFSHAFAGHIQGDETAERMGRLTMNPFAHIDWIGLALLVVVGFGWGKPVPFNPHNLKNKKFGPLLVSLAGPTSNLLLALVSAGAYRALDAYTLINPSNALMVFLMLSVIFNLALMLFNLLPIPPLDGSRVLTTILDGSKYANFRYRLETQGVWILLFVILLDSIFEIGIFSGLFSIVSHLGCNVLLSGSACVF